MCDAVKPTKNSFQVFRGDSHSLVLDAKHHPFPVCCLETNLDVHMIAGVLDGVVQDIRNRGAEILVAASHMNSTAIGNQFLIAKNIGLQMITASNHLDTIPNQLSKIDIDLFPAGSLVASSPSAQHLFNGVSQPIRIFEHQPIKLLLARIRQLTSLQ